MDCSCAVEVESQTSVPIGTSDFLISLGNRIAVLCRVAVALIISRSRSVVERVEAQADNAAWQEVDVATATEFSCGGSRENELRLRTVDHFLSHIHQSGHFLDLVHRHEGSLPATSWPAQCTNLAGKEGSSLPLGAFS